MLLRTIHHASQKPREGSGSRRKRPSAVRNGVNKAR